MGKRREQYDSYINSASWRAKREIAIAAAGFCCTKCGVEKLRGLHVHHLTYERLGDERPEDLQVLCESCHMALHQKKKTRPKAKPKARSQTVGQRIRKSKVAGKRRYAQSKVKIGLIAANESLHQAQVAAREARKRRADLATWS